MNQINFSQNSFVELTEEEMSKVNGGLVYLVIGGALVISFATGVYNGYKDSGTNNKKGKK